MLSMWLCGFPPGSLVFSNKPKTGGWGSRLRHTQMQRLSAPDDVLQISLCQKCALMTIKLFYSVRHKPFSQLITWTISVYECCSGFASFKLVILSGI